MGCKRDRDSHARACRHVGPVGARLGGGIRRDRGQIHRQLRRERRGWWEALIARSGELGAKSPNGHDHGADGRWQRHNVAARRHGLRAGSKVELRRRSRRVSRLVKRLAEAFADAGRPLEALSFPLAVKWAELETLRVDLYAAIQKSPTNEKLRNSHLATTRLQVAIERELRMTPALGMDMRATELDPVLQVMQLRAANNE